MAADQNLQVAVVLPIRNQTELTSLLGRLYDPTSPDFRHFLTVEQFAERFGPSPADYQTVVSYLQVNGLTVTDTPANRLIVPISGTVTQINQAFNLTMNVYRHPTENRDFFSPDREPSLNLGVQVAHIAGLNNYSLPHPIVQQALQGQAIANVIGSGPGGSYLGSDMRAAYYGGTILTGTGQSVGLVEFGGYLLSDVNASFSNAGQTYSVPINNVFLGGATIAPVNQDGEQVLDIVQAIGMAPGLSQVRVYIGNAQLAGQDVLILNSMASENIAKQLSCSWSWTPDDPSTDDVFFQEMAAQGQSFFAASGDDGAFDAAISPYFYPQEDAYVTAVGATHLTTSGAGGAWASESGWNSEGHGSGGGISPDSIAIPSWQVGLANSSNAGSTTLRNVPDVAMEGDFDNYACNLGSCSAGYAGTSFAAPRWAGFMALVNQQAVEAGAAPTGGLGFINPALYSIAGGAGYTNDLHDITLGNNDTQAQPVWFNAVTGYDLVTGWGSPTGQPLIDALAGPQVPGFWLESSVGTLAVNQGSSSSTTITVADAGGFSGSVTLAVTSPLPTGVTASWGTNPTSGTSVLTLTASSTAPSANTTVTVTGTSGSLTVTTNFTVAVHGPSFTLSASPASLTLNQSASGTSTVTVAPLYGFTGSVNLAVTSGLPAGVTASFGINPTTGTSVLTLSTSSTATPGTSTLTITGTSGSLTATTTLALTVDGPSFTLSNSGSVSIGQGSSGSAYVYVYSQFAFAGNVTLAVSGLPSGVTASFATNPISVSSGTDTIAALTLTASSAAAVGQYTVTVTGTSGSLTATTTLTLGVYAPTFTLGSLGSVTIGQGHSVTSNVYIYPQYGFSGNVNLAVTGLPSGVTASFSANPVAVSSNSESFGYFTLTASSTAALGTATLTITGTSGSQTATTTLALGVYVPTFTLTTSNVNIGQGTSATTYVYANAAYGFNGNVSLAATGLPNGVTASFSPNPTTYSSTLILTASSNAPLGTYTVTITGTSGSQTVTTTMTLGVYTPTFTLSASSLNIGQGTSYTTYVYAVAEYGFTGSVSLAATGLPNGVTASFSPNPTTYSSTLTLTASSTAALGTYTVTITGTSGSQTVTAKINLGVYTPTFTLSAGSANIGQGASTTAYVYATAEYGFTGGVTLTASGLPNGVTASFSPNPTTYSSTLYLSASSAAVPGTYTVTITGTSGSQTVTTTITLGVYPQSFTLSAGIPSISQGGSGTSYVYVYSQYGFAGSVNLAVTGLPSGVTGTFATNPVSVSSNSQGSSTLTLTASSTASLGSYPVTITGTSGALTASTTGTLTVSGTGFTLSVGSLSINQGGSGTSSVLLSSQGGFSGSVSLAASGLPSGVTASFAPNPASVNSGSTGTSVLTLSANNSATAGTATVTVTGTSGSYTVSTTLLLTVTAPSFTLSDAPSNLILAAGSSGSSTVYVNPLNGFNGSVNFAVSGLPSGVTASWNPNPATGSSVLTLTASNSAPAGASTATVTGTSGALTATIPLLVTVRGTPATTSTTLAVTSGGAPVTSAASGSLVVLTAAVSGGSNPLTAGQVNFCDAAATYCEDIHLLGVAQLTSSGTATLKFFPGMGSHSYKAVFVGTNSYGTSTSSAWALTVTATNASTTTVAASGSAGNYSLTATVTAQGLVSPTGNVSFLDTTSSNAAVATAALGQATTALSWGTLPSPATGTQPFGMASADFNGDGIPDLAVSNVITDTVTILLGQGDGKFTATAVSPTTGTEPVSIAAADFNGDGVPDLAIANFNSSTLTILLGDGDGTFAQPSTIATGSIPISVVAGDFNGDGIQDLAVANQESNTLTILLGNGNGTFSPAASPSTGTQPRSIGVGDFNGDGIQDLAVANAGSNNVTILLGNGDGTFSPTSGSPRTGSSPLSIVVGDFNGDGIKDLVVGNSTSNSVTVLLGNGNGTFTPTAATPATGTYPAQIAVGDFNGDGKVDLATANYNSNNITILAGNGDGTFASQGTVSTGVQPWGIVAAQFNKNGSLGLAGANNGSNTVTVIPLQLTQTATATATGVSVAGSGTHYVDASYPGDSNYSSSVSATTGLTAAGPPPFGYLDEAVDNATGSTSVTQSDSLLVSGWAADVTDGAPLGNVKVYVDGTLFGTPTVGLARPDVAAAYGNAAYTNSGYQLLHSAASLAVGTHSVTVIATDAEARSTTLGPIAITVSAPLLPPFGHLDQATDSVTGSATVLQSGSLLVRGWAADVTDGAPLSNVKVYVDGASIGTPTLGIARPDVAAAYGNSGYTNSGFQLLYSAASLSVGTHSVSVIATDSGARSTTLGPIAIAVTAPLPPPFGHLDQATDSVTGSATVLQSGSLLVRGWAADVTDGAPLSNVKVYVDGTSIGTPTLGIVRTDVASAYGNSGYTDSGFQLLYSAALLSVGTHSVSVIATDSGARSTTFGPIAVTVAAPLPAPFGYFDQAVDNVTGSATVSQSHSLLISGWAADVTDGAPLSNVKIYVDGASIGTPTLGIARPDVAAAYNNSAYTNSGYQLLYSAALLSVGTHSLTVVATDSGGRSTTFGPIAIAVAAGPPPPFGYFDQAVDNVTGSTTVAQPDSLLVSGWAADVTDGAPLSNVTVYVDGTWIGKPTVGIARPDVATAYGNSAYTDSGYQLSYPASSLSVGTHSVTVIAIDSGGSSTTFGPLRVTVSAH